MLVPLTLALTTLVEAPTCHWPADVERRARAILPLSDLQALTEGFIVRPRSAHHAGPPPASVSRLRPGARGAGRAGRRSPAARDCGRALSDFGILTAQSLPAAWAERELFGRGACPLELGDEAGAAGDFARYLERFPNGRFAEQVRAQRLP